MLMGKNNSEYRHFHAVQHSKHFQPKADSKEAQQTRRRV